MSENLNEPAAPPPEHAPEHPPEPHRGWLGMAMAALLVLALVALVVTFPRWRELAGFPAGEAPILSRVAAPPATPATTEDLRAELDATRERLRLLEAKVAQLAETPSPTTATPSAAPPAISHLEQSVRALEARPQLPPRLTEEVAELRKNAADAAAVLRLADRVEQTETAMRELQSRRGSAAALLLAVGQLREAMAQGMPFDAELRALKVLAPEDETVTQAAETVARRAAAGVPTRAALAERFELLAARMVRAEALPLADGWWRQTANRLMSLVTIRREDGAAAGDGAASVVARAQGRLAQGDLGAAARELGRLNGGPAEVAGPWIADARDRVAADRALAELTAHTVALTGAAAAGR